jgi:hypothetical protein
MTQEQVLRVQRELLPGSGCFPNGDPFLVYGIWVLPFTKLGSGLKVFLVDRAISSEADHEKAREEAVKSFRRAVARKDKLRADRNNHHVIAD